MLRPVIKVLKGPSSMGFAAKNLEDFLAFPRLQIGRNALVGPSPTRKRKSAQAAPTCWQSQRRQGPRTPAACRAVCSTIMSESEMAGQNHAPFACGSTGRFIATANRLFSTWVARARRKIAIAPTRRASRFCSGARLAADTSSAARRIHSPAPPKASAIPTSPANLRNRSAICGDTCTAIDGRSSDASHGVTSGSTGGLAVW
jgi:hypothetical protein